MAPKTRAPRLATGAARNSVELSGFNGSKDSANVIRFQPITVAIEVDPGWHGWHVRARRGGRLHYWRNSFALLSTATDNAADLATSRQWWWSI